MEKFPRDFPLRTIIMKYTPKMLICYLLLLFHQSSLIICYLLLLFHQSSLIICYLLLLFHQSSLIICYLLLLFHQSSLIIFYCKFKLDIKTLKWVHFYLRTALNTCIDTDVCNAYGYISNVCIHACTCIIVFLMYN